MSVYFQEDCLIVSCWSMMHSLFKAFSGNLDYGECQFEDWGGINSLPVPSEKKLENSTRDLTLKKNSCRGSGYEKTHKLKNSHTPITFLMVCPLKAVTQSPYCDYRHAVNIYFVAKWNIFSHHLPSQSNCRLSINKLACFCLVSLWPKSHGHVIYVGYRKIPV